MQKEQSAHLTAFYRSWLDWVEAGAIEGSPYRLEHGLCRCLTVFEENHNLVDNDVRQEMILQFAYANLNPVTPFDCDVNAYHAQPVKHANKGRLQWVKDHAVFLAQ